MTFTYVDPGANSRDKVRFLIGDTDSNDQHFSDEEVAYLLSTWGNNEFDAAIAGAEVLAGRYAHLTNYSRSIGDLTISEQYGESAKEFNRLADRLRRQKHDLYPTDVKINAQAIIATADKNVTTYKSDFYTGIHDYNV